MSYPHDEYGPAMRQSTHPNRRGCLDLPRRRRLRSRRRRRPNCDRDDARDRIGPATQAEPPAGTTQRARHQHHERTFAAHPSNRSTKVPKDIVDFVDGLIKEGKAGSRAIVITRALQRECRRSIAARDAEILARTGSDLDADCVVSCDNIVTVPARVLGPQIGVLLLDQEDALTTAIHAALDLD